MNHLQELFFKSITSLLWTQFQFIFGSNFEISLASLSVSWISPKSWKNIGKSNLRLTFKCICSRSMFLRCFVMSSSRTAQETRGSRALEYWNRDWTTDVGMNDGCFIKMLRRWIHCDIDKRSRSLFSKVLSGCGLGVFCQGCKLRTFILLSFFQNNKKNHLVHFDLWTFEGIHCLWKLSVSFNSLHWFVF